MKPTSVYTVVKVPNSLVVVAHLSEGIPRFWLIDQVSLETFVFQRAGVRAATCRRGQGARGCQRLQRNPDPGIRDVGLGHVA